MGLFTYNLCINLLDDEKFCDDHDVGTISTTHDDIEDNDDDAGDDDSEDDSNDGDLLEPSSQTETEEEPIMVDETVSSDTEPEDCGNRMKHHDKIKDCPRDKK
jgi:hypothetical protein